MSVKKGRAIFYFLLNSISLLADSVFVYYIGLLLLQGKNGGMLCSLVLGLDPFFEIAIGPFLAKFIDTVPDLKIRLKNSLFLQCALTLFTLFFALLNPKHPALMIIPLAFIRFFSLIDSQLKLALPIFLEKNGILPLTQSLSLHLFSQRFVLLMSSSLALIFLNFSWFSSCALNSFTYIFAILALLLILKIKKNEEQNKRVIIEKKNDLSILNVQKKQWIKWNCTLVFLSGIAFGSVTLILTKCMLISEDVSLQHRILEGPAPIYAGVFFSLALMMAVPSKVHQITKNGRQICAISSLLAIGLVIAAFVPLYIRIGIFFILGILNGIGLVGLDAFFQKKIEGDQFVRALAKNQAWGKAGVLLSLAGVGLAIDLRFDPFFLLALCGILGLAFCLALFFHASKLENEKKTICPIHLQEEG